MSAHVLKFPNFTKPFEVHIDAHNFAIERVFMQYGHLIAFKSNKSCGVQLQWPIHEKKLYVIMCCLKAWQHYLGMHKTKIYMDNVSLHYFEMQLRVLMKQRRWHDTLALLDVELIHKLGKVYSILYGGRRWFPQVQVMVSLVSSRSPVACPNTKGAPTLY